MHAQIRRRIGCERFGGEGRPQVGTADADIDYVRDRASRRAFHGARPQRIGEAAHLRAHTLHVLRHVAAVQHDRTMRTQRGVKHGPVFGHVDALTRREPPDPGSKLARLGERNQQAHRFGRHEVLRIVEQQTRRLDGEAIEAA